MIAARNMRVVLMVLALPVLLAGCAGGSVSSWDPTDLLDFLDTKKKLPGDRRAVFPEGVPGVEPGVPQQMMKGNQPPPDAAPAEPAPPPAAEPAPAPKRAAPKRTASKPRPRPQAQPVQDDSGADDAPPPPPQQQRQQPQGQSQAQPQGQSGSSAFPAPLPSGTFQR